MGKGANGYRAVKELRSQHLIKCQRCLQDIKKLLLSWLALYGARNGSYYLLTCNVFWQFSSIDFLNHLASYYCCASTGGKPGLWSPRPPEPTAASLGGRRKSRRREYLLLLNSKLVTVLTVQSGFLRLEGIFRDSIRDMEAHWLEVT